MLKQVQVYEMLCIIAAVYEEKKEELSGYDAVIGDGDHGYSLARGNRAAIAKIKSLGSGTAPGELFKQYGRELTCQVGGAMGPLFGLLFTQIGKACGDSLVLDLSHVSGGLEQALDLICELGGAKLGDKTMVDAIIPAVDALKTALKGSESLEDGLRAAAVAAEKGVESTIAMTAKKGRSKYLLEKSAGHQDAGATSFYYLIKTMYEFTAKEVPG